MPSALNISSKENDALIERKNSKKESWSTIQLLLISVIVFCVAGIVSNIDRIIDLLSHDNVSSSNTINNDMNIDILIVGGGATGIIEMNFLRQQYPNKKILLIEKQNYMGGRTLSSNITYNNKQITIDMGAWRITYNSFMWQVLYYLDLCDDLIFFYRNTSSINNEAILYFRNNIIDNWTSYDEIYRLTELDNNFFTNDINPYTTIYNDILMENNNDSQPSTLQEWTDKFYHSNWTLNGIPIIQYSVKSVLRNYVNLSNEYLDFMRVHSPSLEPQQMSLIRSLFTRIFRNYSETDDDLLYDNSVKTLKNGFLSIINTFYEEAMATYNNYDHQFDPIWLNTQLLSIDYNELDNKYKYLVKIDSVDDKYKNISYLNAENVILSVDVQSLQKLVPDLKPIRHALEFGVNADDLTMSAADNDKSCFPFINCLTVQVKLYKIALIYDISDVQLLTYLVSKSLSRTDLEINEVFVFGSIDTLTAIMMYPKFDLECIFWNQLQSIAPKYEINENVIVNNMEALNVASTMLVNLAMMQIDELLSLSNNNLTLGRPLAAFVKGFGVNQSSSDAFNQWRYNVDVPTVVEWIKNPNKNERIFISNSDYGNNFWGQQQQTAFINGLQIINKYFNVSNPFHNIPKCSPP